MTPEATDAPADASFEQLYKREYEPMCRLAYLMVGESELAQDLVQEAFATTFRRWDDLDNAGGFLRTSVINRCRDASRFKRRRTQHALPPDAHSPEADPVELHLRDAIRTLNSKQRAVVVLRFYLDYSIEQVAHELNLKAGTVKSIQNRALQRLRVGLTEKDQTSPPISVLSPLHAVSDPHIDPTPL